MKRMRNALSLLLALLFFLSAAAGCSKEKDDAGIAQPAETAAADQTAPAENEEEQELLPAVPEDLDYGGQDIRFLINQQFGTHDLTGDNGGDVVFDAVYDRNLCTEERLNVRIVPEVSEQSHSELLEKVRQTIIADTDPYHVYLARGPEAAALSLDGCLYSTEALTYVDMDRSWWNKTYTENMAINRNDLEYLVGDLNMSVFMCSNAVFFNKSDFTDRFGDYEEKLYQVVFDGKWTYDVFMDFVEQSYEDLNGNGQADEADHYGIVYLDYAQDWYISSAGVTFMGRDEEGFPTLQLYNDNTVRFCETLQTLFSTPTYGWCFVGEQLDMGNFFKSRNTLFLPGRFTYVDGNLRDMEDPYGVIPYPKVTEDMAYMSASGHSGNFIAVPANNRDPEMISAVLEVMTAESARTVFPTYYEIALKIKYSDGGVDAEMIDIVHDCMNFYVTSNVMINGERIGTILQDVVMTDKEFSSAYKSQIGKKEQLLADLIDLYKKSHNP